MAGRKTKAKIQAPPGNCDLLILIALKEEADVLDRFSFLGLSEHQKFANLSIRFGRFRAADGSPRRVAVLVTGEVGERIREAIALACERIKPSVIVNIGISGRYARDALIGDVVLPSEYIKYDKRSKMKDAPDGDFDIELGGAFMQGDLGLNRIAVDMFRNGQIKLLSITDYCDSFEKLTKAERATVTEILGDGELSHDPKLVEGIFAAGNFVVKSENFKQVLRQKSPDIVAIDMESAAASDALRALEAPPLFISIRGISDGADDSKERFDRLRKGLLRRWAVSNVSRVVQPLIKQLPFPKTSREDPAKTSDYPIMLAGGQYRAIFPGQKFKDYLPGDDMDARFVNLRRTVSKGSSQAMGVTTLLGELQAAKPSSSFVIRGSSGCGKSSLLYFLFRSLHENDPSISVAFLDLAQFVSRDAAGPRVNSEFASTLSDIRQHIQTARRSKSIVFIDGCIGHPRERSFLEQLNEALQEFGMISIYTEGADHRRLLLDGLKRDPQLDDFSFDGEYELKAIAATNREACTTLIGGLLASYPVTGLTSSSVYDDIVRLGFPYVNHFVVSLYVENCRKRGFREAETSTQFVERAMMAALARGQLSADGANFSFSDVCIECLRAHTRRLGTAPEGHRAKRAYQEIFAKYPRIVQNVLIARAVITLFGGDNDELDLFTKYGIDRTEFLSTVWDNDVSASIKDIMQERAVETRMIDAAAVLLENLDEMNMSFCMYILGRATTAKNREKAIEALRKNQELVTKTAISAREAGRSEETSKDTKFIQLSARTLHVSLAYLGDEESTEDYLNRLFSDRFEDELNRGFHLEYYSDTISDDVGVDLVFKDELTNWSRTKNQLLRRVRPAIANRRLAPIDRIRLVTYLSFVRIRHENGKLSQEDRKEALEIIGMDGALEQNIGPAALRYVRMLRRNLKHESFDALSFVISLYKLKALPRIGWRRRGIAGDDLPESVGSHTFGVSLLANLLVDKRDPFWKSIDVDQLQRLALFHDIGEFEVGDYEPGSKHLVDEDLEVDYIASMGCYRGLGDLKFVSDLFAIFESQSTPTARLARELDKLDALIQGYIYRDRFPSRENYETFVKDHVRHVVSLPLREFAERIMT